MGVGVRQHPWSGVDATLDQHQVRPVPVAELVVVAVTVDHVHVEEEAQAVELLGQMVQQELRESRPGPTQEQQARQWWHGADERGHHISWIG